MLRQYVGGQLTQSGFSSEPALNLEPDDISFKVCPTNSSGISICHNSAVPPALIGIFRYIGTTMSSSHSVESWRSNFAGRKRCCSSKNADERSVLCTSFAMASRSCRGMGSNLSTLPFREKTLIKSPRPILWRMQKTRRQQSSPGLNLSELIGTPGRRLSL